MTVDVALCARQSEPRPSPAPPDRGRKRRKSVHVRPDARPTLAPWQVRLATQIMQRDFSSSISILDVACQCRLSLIGRAQSELQSLMRIAYDVICLKINTANHCIYQNTTDSE